MATFRFWTNKFVRQGTTNVFQGVFFDVEAKTPEQAEAAVLPQVPEGFKIMAWSNLSEVKCTSELNHPSIK